MLQFSDLTTECYITNKKHLLLIYVSRTVNEYVASRKTPFDHFPTEMIKISLSSDKTIYRKASHYLKKKLFEVSPRNREIELWAKYTEIKTNYMIY